MKLRANVACVYISILAGDKMIQTWSEFETWFAQSNIFNRLSLPLLLSYYGILSHYAWDAREKIVEYSHSFEYSFKTSTAQNCSSSDKASDYNHFDYNYFTLAPRRPARKVSLFQTHDQHEITQNIIISISVSPFICFLFLYSNSESCGQMSLSLLVESSVKSAQLRIECNFAKKPAYIRARHTLVFFLYRQYFFLVWFSVEADVCSLNCPSRKRRWSGHRSTQLLADRIR